MLVLYGAGSLGFLFSQRNLHSSLEEIIFVDSCPETWGQTVNGIPVLEPTTPNLNRATNVLITTMWVREVYEKLRTLGISHRRIWVPAKPMIYGRASILSPAVSAQVIDLLSDSFARLEDSFDAYVDFGTLLGLWRDGALIEHDEDVDVSVLGVSGSEHKTLAGIVATTAAGVGISASVESLPNSSSVVLEIGSSVVPVGIEQFAIKNGAIYSRQNPHYPDVDVEMIVPLKRLSALPNIRVPHDTTSYLRERYGASWQTPTSEWAYLYGAQSLNVQVLTSFDQLFRD